MALLDEEGTAVQAPAALREDDEPRALAVIEACAGVVPGHDPSRRWEAPLTVDAEAPVLVRPVERMVPARSPLDDLRRIDVSTTEYTVSPEIATALTHRSPQWFLRDLGRPQEPPLSPFGVHEDTDPRERWEAALREASRARVLPARPAVVSTAEILAEERTRKHELLGELWQPALPDDAPRRVIHLHGGVQ